MRKKFQLVTKSPSSKMWPQIIMPKEAKLDEQEGLEWSWETGLCPWYFLVSSCWASHPWGLSLSHLLHPGKKGGGHKGAAPTFSGLPSCKGRKPRQTGCGTEGTPASGDSEGRAGCAWNFFFFQLQFYFIFKLYKIVLVLPNIKDGSSFSFLSNKPTVGLSPSQGKI